MVLVAVSGLGCAASGLPEAGESTIARPGGWTPVPLVDFRTPHHAIDVEVDVAQSSARLVVDGRAVSVGVHHLPIRVLALDPRRLVVFSRRLFTGELSVDTVDTSTGRVTPVALPDAIRDERLFRQAAVFGREVVFVAYHIRDHYSLFVYRLRPTADGGMAFDRDWVRQLAFKGRYEISTPVRMAEAKGFLYVCGEGFCYRACGEAMACHGDPLVLIDLGIGRRRLVELAADPAGGVAGLYVDADSPPLGRPAGRAFQVFDIASGQPHPDWSPGDDVPLRLEWRQGRPVTVPARSADDVAALFERDVLSGDSAGLLNLGENNLEGRIAWSQVYYLSGFIDILRAIDAGRLPGFVRVRDALQRRVDLEVAMWDRLLDETYPHMLSRRYTTAREATLHAVQTGRILRTLKRYRELPRARAVRNLDRFMTSVRTLAGHIEAFAVADASTPFLPPGRRYLWWPRGVPFPTYDGVPLPYNHMDDWAGGVLHGESSAVRSEPFALAARDSVQTLIDLEFSKGLPDNFEWHYWWGRVPAGWTKADNVSVHQPDFAGLQYIAHVSYRTIDMMALLSAAQVFPELLPAGMLDYLERAVTEGGLYPFLIEDLERHGRRPALPAHLAVAYLRPDSAAGFQSAAFAYEAFSRFWVEGHTTGRGRS